jgi:hypothetical protein
LWVLSPVVAMVNPNQKGGHDDKEENYKS